MFITGTLKPEIKILFCNQERPECEKCVNYNSFVTWDRSFFHMDRRTFFADVKASFEDFERADVVEANYENLEYCELFF